MYVDESGDGGNVGGTDHFILTGLIIKYSNWQKKLDLLKRARKYLRDKYKLPVHVELHAKELVRIKKLKAYKKINKTTRVQILKEYSSFIPKMFYDCKVINICFHKANHQFVDNFQKLAWERLITRYDSFLKKTVQDEGMIISDDGSEHLIRSILRKARVYNPIKSMFTQKVYNAKVTKIIEDVSHRQSHNSYFIQTVDVLTYLLYNNEYPKGSLKKFNLHNMYLIFDPILLKEASSKDNRGIVRD